MTICVTAEPVPIQYLLFIRKTRFCMLGAMPTIWRFLLKEYLKVLTLCTLIFIALLVAMRLEEIAQFAALGANSLYLYQFILYQLPYIIPIALPISALISALLLMRSLSARHEVTALRSSGFGLSHILAPILLMSAFLSLANFVVVSEMSTHAHLMKRVLRKELKSLNPLILLQSERLAHLKGVYAQSFGPGKTGEFASDVLVCLYNPQHECLSLLTARELRSHESNLEADNVTLITTLNPNPEGFDQLLIENSQKLTLPKPDLTQLLGSSGVKVEHDHLKMALLLAKAVELQTKAALTTKTDEEAKSARQSRRHLASIYSELIRRVSVALAVLTYTLLGLAYGIQIARIHSYRSIATVILLAALYITCFFVAKNLAARVSVTAMLYLMPHLIILAFSLHTLRRLSRGEA